jgi:lipoprotein NlpI
MSTDHVQPRAAPIGAILMLALAIFLYAGMMAWLGDLQNPNIGFGRALSAGFAFLFGLALWVVLGILLLIGGVNGEMPNWASITAAILLPLSGCAAAVALGFLEQDGSPFYQLVPGLAPPIISFYAFWARLPAMHRLLRPLPTGLFTWGAIAILTLAPLPRYVAKQNEFAARVQLEKAEAAQKAAIEDEQRRKDRERFAGLTRDSPLWEWAPLFGRNREFDAEAVAAARQLPHKQADAEEALRRGMGFPLVQYRRLDLAATPAFCLAAGDFLSQNAAAHKPADADDGYPSVAGYFEPYDEAIEWLTQTGCDIDEPIARIRATIEAYKQTNSREAYLGALAWHRGNGFYRAGDKTRALAEYDSAIGHAPDDSRFYAARGELLYDEAQYDRAIADYDTALQINPGYPAALNDRGNAYSAKGEYDRALQDYDAAIELNPDFAIAYNNRANVFVHKGDFPRAVADLDKALGIMPNYRIALGGRGRVKFYQASYADAWADLGATLALKPDDAYAVLWLYLANLRFGQNARAALRDDSVLVDHAAWPYPVIAALLGDGDRQELLTRAASDTNPDRQGQLCEADFYLGAADAAAGDTAGARPLLQRASSLCPTRYTERIASEYELKRLH